MSNDKSTLGRAENRLASTTKEADEGKKVEFLGRMKEILEAEDVTPDSCLAGWTTWDSMAVVMVLALLDELCGKELTGEAVMDCEKVGDLMALGGLS